MPLPFGHTLMGYTLYETMPSSERGINWRMFLLFVLVANLPDIDFLPGFILGNANKFHHHVLTHSLGFSVIVGAMIAGYFYLKKQNKFWLYFGMFTAVCFSHVVLDLVTADTSEPLGVPMFWPFSDVYFYSPFSIFMSVNKIGASGQFFQSLFVMHNLRVALWEIALFLPVLVIIKLLKIRGKTQIYESN